MSFFLVCSGWLFGITPETNVNASEADLFSPAATLAPGINYVSDGGCVPVTVQFYSQLGGTGYFWNFGDGGTSTDCNPIHTFTAAGTYTVIHTTSEGTDSVQITVGDNPVVTFAGDSFACQYDSKNYTVASTIPAATYSWVAHGGTVTTSNATSASITWNSYGVNTIQYTITTAAGCTKVFEYKVKVIPPPQVNLPCCERKGSDNPQGGGSAGHNEGVPGGPEPCDVCAGSYSCYQATIDPQFGISGDYYWNWTVTNGTIVQISNDSTKICVVWGSSGTGTIVLEAEHKVFGCKTIRECELVINPGVTPAFTVSGNCMSQPVVFDASGTTPISEVVSYFWEFGDGYTETTVLPTASHQYAFAGTYTATLTITTRENCIYKISQTFTVISGTRPQIECPGTVCEGSRHCYSTAFIPGASYSWTIGGDIPIQQTVSANGNEICVTWGPGPVGTIGVTVTGGGYTCTNTATEVVAIVGDTIPIEGPDVICDDTYQLELSTTNYTGACYNWIVNGVSMSANGNELSFDPSAPPFNTASTLNISVEVDFGLGCCRGRGVKTVKKLQAYTMMLNSSNSTVCVGSQHTYFMFFPSGVPSPPVSWLVDGGTVDTATSTYITVTWNTVGTGSITAGNNTPGLYCNNSGNSTWNISVLDKATGEDPTGPALVCADGVTSYTYYHGFASPTGSASVSVFPIGGTTLTAGTYSSDVVFNLPGTYTISVTYNHNSLSNCGTTKTYTVIATDTIIPTFTIPSTDVCEGEIETYTASISDTSLYDWHVVGGTILAESWTAGTLSLQVQWNSTVTSNLTITNKACSQSNSQDIVVHGKPIAIITPGSINCSTTSVGLSVAPIWSGYQWSTGATGSSISVSTPGTYWVEIFNGYCYDTATITVPVVNPTAPVINSFTVTPPSSNNCPKYHQICPNITPGSGSIVSYSWTFSGFTIGSSSATCPSVALASNPGTGTWTLTITDSYGCTSSLSGNLSDTCTPGSGTGGTSCTPLPTFSISYDPCTGQFTSTGTDYTAVSWYYGDGNTGSGFNPVHFYSSPCNKTVTCLVTNINGCVTAFNFTISVPYAFSSPQINVANSACNGASTITATGLSECGASTATYDWTITPAGGGVPYTVTTTSNTLNVGGIGAISSGNHNATVTINVGGCSRTVSTSFNKGGLEAFFVSCGGCAGSPLTFADLTVPYQAPLIQWQWSFSPSAYTSELQNPTINFTTPGSYNAQLIVTDNNLCVDTHTVNITVLPAFVPGDIQVNGNPTASGTSFDICPGEVYTLTAPAGATYIWSDGSTTDSISVSEPGDYYVTVFNASNCAAKVGPIKIRHKPGPEAIILSSGNCSPKLLRAFTGTGYTYGWVLGGSTVSSQPYYYLSSTNTVTLAVTNVHGCSDSVTESHTVFPSPSAYISYAPQPFCPGTTVTLTANVSSGTSPYGYLWNNGSASASFSTSTPGLYSCTVTDANGCTAETQYDLQPALPPGMDKLPYGCYDVCGPVTFCDGLMPFGWTGEWYNGATLYTTIAQNAPIAVPFNSPGTYTLHYVPVNPSLQCPAVSKPITINFDSLPTFTITGSTNPIVLCTGTGQSTLLTVNPQSPQYTYNWYFGGSLVGTGYTYSASSAGTYTVEIIKNACCKTQVQVTIDSVDCCFDHPGVPFQQILTDTIISSDQFWYDKYYIDAKVTVVGNATLDLTNVDCAFGTKGEIVLEDNSFLRTNNSVLRPCEQDSIWLGIDFRDLSSGWINTTTIKNAVVAVDIRSSVTGTRLTDNTFIKCQTSVWITNSTNQKSISGNTFEVDNSLLKYPTNPNEYFAIRLDNVDMEGLIAQNDFRHVHPQKGNNRYYGIYSRSAAYTASENQFNDMFRAVDVSGSRNVVALEENEIKLNTLKETYDSYQVRVTDCETPVLIYENRFDNGLGDASTAGAIYCEQTYRTHIKDNTLNGFYISINAINTHFIHISSNEVTSCSRNAIALYGSDNSIVSCNTLNSMATNANQFGGVPMIGIMDWEGTENFEYANCIFNMHSAFYLYSSSNSNLPTLVNNYMYNYWVNGVYNDGYTGSIGNPGGATNAGRNTFMSNNATSGTVDINSVSTLINEGGNFGILITNNVNSTTGQDEYYSTSDCGHQIERTYQKNQLDRYNICDIYYLDEWIDKSADGRYILKEPAAAISTGYIDEQLLAGNNAVLGQIAAQMLQGVEPAKKAADAVLASQLDRNLAARLIVSHFLAIHEPGLASAYLAAPQLIEIHDDLRVILEIGIAIADQDELTGQQRSVLVSIDQKDHEFSPLARDIIQARRGEHDYKFFVLPEPQIQRTDNPLVRTGNALDVYPVPAPDEIHVKHHVNDANVEAVRIISATGSEVEDFSYTMQSGVVTIDVSALAPGMYTVVLVTDGQQSKGLSGRFIKR